MTRTATALLAILSLTRVAGAQATRDVQRTVSGTATLSGTVVSDEFDPRPLRHARVTCSAAELTDGITAISDAGGRFTCAQLPAGRYTITVTRDGWVPAAYGAKGPQQPGAQISLAAGAHVDVVIRMVRGAVITGTLLDGNGQPAAGATVVALRASIRNGERRLDATGAPAIGDDRGVYRIFGLPPGDYFVGGGPSGTMVSITEARLTTDIDLRQALSGSPSTRASERHVAFASTYYPGTAIAAQATAITLAPGEERGDIDFALQMVPTAQVDGSVLMPDGSPAPAALVSLLASGPGAFAGNAFDGLKTTRPTGDGTFAFSGIAPGTYTVLARVAAPAVLWAGTQIAVDGEPVSGLTLALQPALSLSGHVQIDSSAGPLPFALSSVTVTAEPVPASGEISLAPSPATVDASGRFVVRGVTPGRYRLVATLPPAARGRAWTQRSGVIGGIDSLQVPVSITRQPPGDAIVTLSGAPREKD